MGHGDAAGQAVFADRKFGALHKIEQVFDVTEQEAVVLDLQYHMKGIQDRIHGQLRGKQAEAGFRGDDPAVQRDADVVLPGHVRLPVVFHHRPGLVAPAVHQAVALRRKGVIVGQQGPVVPQAEPLRLLPPQAQRPLALIRPLLLLHLQHGEVRPGAVGAQPELPPQLQSVQLVVKILVIRRVEVQGADRIALGPVVGVPVHDGPQAPAQNRAVRKVDGIFFLLAQNLVHCSLPFLPARRAGRHRAGDKTSCAWGAPGTQAKAGAHEVFAHVGRPGPRAFDFMAVPLKAAHGRFCCAFTKQKPAYCRTAAMCCHPQ